MIGRNLYIILMFVSLNINSQGFLNVSYLNTDFKITDTLKSSVPDDYNWSAGFYDINPINNKLVHVHQRGSSHWSAGDCQDIMIRRADNYWSTLSDDSYLMTIPENQYTELGGGFLKSGRMILLYSVRECSTGSHIGLYNKYSDNNGLTLSDSSFMDTSSFTGFKVNIMPQKILELSNEDILWFGSSHTLDQDSGAIVCYRSTNNGISFDSVNVILTFKRGIGYGYFPVEPTGVNFYDSVIVIFARDLDRAFYRQWTSTNYGITWRDDGVFNMGESLVSSVSYTHTGFLSKFYYKDSLIIENTFYNRYTNELKVIYANPDNLAANGASAWDQSTKRTLIEADVLGENADGYMYVFQVGNTPEAYGVIVNDDNNARAEVYYYNMPTTHIDTIYNILYP